MALPACKLAARLDRRKSPCTSSLGDVLCACVCLCDSTASPPYRGTLHVSMTPTSDANRSPARSPTPNRSKGRGQTKSDPKPAPGDLHRRSPTDRTTGRPLQLLPGEGRHRFPHATGGSPGRSEDGGSYTLPLRKLLGRGKEKPSVDLTHHPHA